MDYGTLEIERTGTVMVIRLNRPDRLNAYVPEMGEDLVRAFRAAATDDAVRAVVLTGNGRAFCAGADRGAFGVRGPSGLALGEEAFIKDFPAELAAHPKFTIAAFNGAAVGVGVTMSLPLDIRLAAAGATLKLNFADFDFLPGLGSSSLLPELIGVSRAKKLLLCDRRITAEQALDAGLVDEVTPPADLLSRALALATAATSCSAATTMLTKRLLNGGARRNVAAAIADEWAGMAELRRLNGVL